MNSLLERGVFVLSIDIEPNAKLARDPICQEVTGLLLKLIEKFNVHATWAVQANLLLDRHEFTIKNLPDAIAEHIRRSGAPLYNGQSVLQQILDCKTPQEIGCHTFSHIRVADPSCTREQFEVELEACRHEFERFGVIPCSFVFPWNSVQFVDSLKKFNYIAYRGPSHNWYTSLPLLLKRLSHLVDHWLLVPSSMPEVRCEMGVWNLPASYYYVCGKGWGKMIPIQLRVRKVKQDLRVVVRKHRLFHLWFHPFNLVNNTSVWLKGLENIFVAVCRYRDQGLLDNLTMGELARRLKLQREQ